MSHAIIQEHNEKRFNRRHIDGYIREQIQTHPEMQAKVAKGVQLLRDWITVAVNDGYYASKNGRIKMLAPMDLETLVTDVFVGVAYCLKDEMFTSITAQMASRLRFDTKTSAITTMAEIMAVLCNTDAFDIRKPEKYASLTIISRIPLTPKLITFIDESQYLPPMVVPPMELKTNFDSGYLTHKDSLILGSSNHHDGDLCLDALNIINSVELKLDLEFLCEVEETPTYELDSQQKRDDWVRFKKQSYRFYDLMQSQGNRFYLTHKVDKRGRIYASGYHINSMGTGFKKAMLELAHEEVVEGAP